MGSLLTSAEKNEIQQVFGDLHDTWKREIYIFINEEPTVPVNSTYNPLFGGASALPRTAVRKIEKKYTKYARIFYADKAIEGDNTFSLNIPTSTGTVRLKVDLETLELIKRSSKIEIDGELWSLYGDPHPEGPFSTNYFIVFLKRIN